MSASDWDVSPFCEAKTHNTISASQGRKGMKPCTCPHAVEVNRQHHERYRDRPKRRRLKMAKPKPKPVTGPTYPDFSGGACTTAHGQRAATAGMNDQSSRKGIHERERAKRLCNAGPCPIRDRCRSWVLDQEVPRGSWGGVWGGLDPWNRRGLQLVIDEDGRADTVPFDIESN